MSDRQVGLSRLASLKRGVLRLGLVMGEEPELIEDLDKWLEAEQAKAAAEQAAESPDVAAIWRALEAGFGRL